MWCNGPSEGVTVFVYDVSFLILIMTGIGLSALLSGLNAKDSRLPLMRCSSMRATLRFIPLVIKEAELPVFAETRYYVDFRHASVTEYDRLIANISCASKDRLWAEWVGWQ